MDIRRIDDEEFRLSACVWNAVLEASASPAPTLHHALLSVLADHSPAADFIPVMAWSEGHPVACAAFMRQAGIARTLRLAGWFHSDMRPIAHLPGYDWLIPRLLETAIDATEPFDRVVLNGVTTPVLAALAGSHRSFRPTEITAHYSTRLGWRDWNDFSRRVIGWKQHRELNRHCARIETIGPVRFTVEERDAALISRVTAELQIRRSAARRKPSPFRHPLFRDIAVDLDRAAVDAGFLRAFILWLGEKPLAILAGYELYRRFWISFMAFDPEYGIHAPGFLVLRYAVLDLMSRGVEAIDFGAGEYQYKSRWATDSEPMYTLLNENPGVGSQLRSKVASVREQARRSLADVRLVSWIRLRSNGGVDGQLRSLRNDQAT